MNSLPENIESIVRTLASVMKDPGEQLLVELLQHSSIDIRETSYDNWNGGTYGYTLYLQISVDLFGQIQDNIETIEKNLITKFKLLTRSYDNEYLENVMISPKLLELFRNVVSSDAEVSSTIETIRFWKTGYFRLFFTHLCDQKNIASEIQGILKNYAISAFVAHEDIEPTREWQDEIELALSSMDALDALLTEGFIGSKWCDQEIGVAIGRKVLVIPMRAGVDPYGLIGKYQGVSTLDKTVDTLCSEIFKVLLGNISTKGRLTSGLVYKICNSQSFAESIDTVNLLNIASDNLTQEMGVKLNQAIKNNNQVYKAFGVPGKINSLLQQFAI